MRGSRVLSLGLGGARGREVRQGHVHVELQYLYLVWGQLRKVSATVPQATWQQTDVPLFAKGLATTLAPSR